MTTKDYIIIAEAISNTSLIMGPEADRTLSQLIAELIPRLAADNMRFDARRFMDAAKHGQRLRDAVADKACLNVTHNEVSCQAAGIPLEDYCEACQ